MNFKPQHFILVTVLFLVTCAQPEFVRTPRDSPVPAGSAAPQYDRRSWVHWIDEDGDCQNSRAELLIKTSLQPVEFTSDSRCTVQSGYWIDAYSGLTIVLARDIDIDHIVPLGWANARGGYAWDRELKKRFANDEQNLIPTSKSLNRSKGAKGPTEWMPPLPDFRCDYLHLFDAVVRGYELAYIAEEKEVIEDMLADCGSPN